MKRLQQPGLGRRIYKIMHCPAWHADLSGTASRAEVSTKWLLGAMTGSIDPFPGDPALQRLADAFGITIDELTKEIIPLSMMEKVTDRHAREIAKMRALGGWDEEVNGPEFFAEDQWHDDDRDVLWWWYPICEPPYIGSPLDTDWSEWRERHEAVYWTRIEIPEITRESGGKK